ncbi:MAG: ATP-grasp domain-containing protein [Methylophilaceae bacterium]|nr:ATP-grasp domain-containing protein [Methylophilaceae bacterium]
MDAFADVDTREYAQPVLHVKLRDLEQSPEFVQNNGNFDTADFLRQLKSIQLSDCIGLLYGSGFEGNVELLLEIAKLVPVIGNLPQTVANIKKPIDFFAVLDSLQIDYPEVCFNALANPKGWLIKHAGGSGGMHIQKAGADALLGVGDYFQREITIYKKNDDINNKNVKTVTPFSLLFLADGINVQGIGYNQQLIAPITAQPYRYGGIISNFSINDSTKTLMVSAAKKITVHYALRGLNSLDALVINGGLNEQVMILEINPRLSASLALYQFEQENLLTSHIQSCQSGGLGINNIELIKFESIKLTKNKESIANAVFYAPYDINIKMEEVWPDWTADIPQPNTYVKKDEPVCTVMAAGHTVKLAHRQLCKRLDRMRTMLKFVSAVDGYSEY